MSRLKKIFVFLLFGCIFLSCKEVKDPTEKQIDDLLAKMTLEEKIGQMNQLNGTGITSDMEDAIRNGEVGSILNEVDVKTINKLQKIAVEESRLGIPIIFARDVIHGYKTIFPIPLGQAATWNPILVEKGAQVAAQEASSSGIRWTFAPMIDVCRDPRWGRIAESLGEDTYLASVMGVAMVKGFQGDDLSSPSAIAACAKHFAGYGASEAGKDYNTTWIPELQLREVFLPPFQAVSEAGVATFMCSFNDINGIPASGSQFLNRTILRDEWKYDGMLVSDWGSIEQMISHGFCTDLSDAAQKAISAGVDMDMEGYAYIKHLEELVRNGTIKESIIDDAVKNILRLKIRLGLFESPYTDESVAYDFYRESSLQAAKEAAIESVILLKNEREILPLDDNIKTITVVGPLSDAPADQLGTWCFDGESEYAVTPLAALRKYYGNRVKILFEYGLEYSREYNDEGIKKAVAKACQSDVILFFAGEEAILSGEARSRADISLPGQQTEMLKELKKTGKPIVMIVMAGRPLTIEKEVALSDAVLYAFHPGTMAGPALADLLFGKAVPSGKLPVTIPKMVGQVPIYYSHKNTGRPASDITMIDDIEPGVKQTSLGFTSYHLDAGDSPLFPFGYGLSYTTFKYGRTELSSKTIGVNDELVITCEIKNVGKYAASEIVQLYIRDMVGSLIRPVKELKRFGKVTIEPNQSKKITFHLPVSDLAFWHNDKEKKIEPGEFMLWIAPNSQSGEGVSFNLK